MLKCERKVKWLMEEMTYKYIGKKIKNSKRKVNFVVFRFRLKLNKKCDQNVSSFESYRLLKTAALHMLFLILFTNHILLGVAEKKIVL